MCESIRVGYGRADITPTGVIPLQGFGNASQRHANHVLDRLYITCIAFTDSLENTALLFTVDLINMQGHVTAKIRQRLHQLTGVAQDHIMISATHTHSGPSCDDACMLERLVEGAVKAGTEAIEDQAEATMMAGSVMTQGLTFVRHYVNADGSVAGNGFGKYKDVVAHTTQADRQLQILRCDRPEKKPVILANFQAHPSMTGFFDKLDISADFPGAFRAEMEQRMDCCFAYFAGAAGNLNSVSRFPSENLPGENTYLTHGKALADYTIALMDQLRPVRGGLVKAMTRTFTGKANHADADKLPYCEMVIDVFEKHGPKAATEAGLPYGLESVSHARRIIDRETQLGETLDMDVYALKVGNIGFALAPYEMYDTHGMYIKEHSPMDVTFVLECSNDHHSYLPSKAAYTYGKSGAYEAYVCKFPAGTAEELASCFVSMLENLHEGKER